MSILELQKRIIALRVRYGWASATNLEKTTCGFAEEVGEWERARRDGDREKMLCELADICVYALGAFEILQADAVTEITKVVEINEIRVYKTHR